MFYHSPFREAFGLDIGDLSLKLVELSIAKKLPDKTIYKINDHRQISLPAGCILGGEIQQPEIVRKKLIQLLDKAGYNKKIKSPWVVADLPEPKTFLTSIELDLLPEQISREDVELNSRQHLPFNLEDAYLSYEVIPRIDSQTTTRVLIGAVEKIIADSYTYLLESANLQPIALEIEGLAIARAVLEQKSTSGGIILDLGATRSAIIIYDQGGIRFSTSLNFSGEMINVALSQQIKIDYQKIEQLKIKTGLNYTKEFPNYLKIVDGLIGKLTDDINKVLNYYQNHYPNTQTIEKIVLCGGLSTMDNLRETLIRRLKIYCEFANPWKNIAIKDHPLDKKSGLTMVSAIGLAMRATLNPYNE